MIAIVLSSVPHYYAARLRAVLADAKGGVSILSVKGHGDFSQFIEPSVLDDLPITELAGSGRGSAWSGTVAFLDRVCPEVVAIAGWSTKEAFAAIWWARRHAKRLVIMSASQAIDAPRSRYREFIKRRIVSLGDAALVAGQAQREYIASLGMREESVFLGYDAVDNTFFERGADSARQDAQAVRARLGLPERYILASGRFLPKKNFVRLVEAYGRAVAGIDAAPDLVLLGDGPARAEIEAAVHSGNLAGRVHLPGFQNYLDLPAFYGLAEAFVHVPTSEQWGLVINEAAAAGLPLLISRPCGAAAELLKPGVNGFLVEPGDTADIARALTELMTLPPEVSSGFGNASRGIVADWGTARFSSGFHAACEAATRARPKTAGVLDMVLIRALAMREITAVS